MSQKTNLALLIIVSACTFFFCIRRDIQLEKQYTGDLRNRIVGARLQKDGRLPYFYKWSAADSLRYYDPQNFDSFKVSNITGTPFLHQLLYPLAELPQRDISRVWLVIEYGLLLLTLGFAISLAATNTQRWMVILGTLLFACTAAWKGHVAAGQYYILIPALCMLFYMLITGKKSLFYSFLTGATGAALIVLRPNAVLFFIPFLFYRSKCTWRNKLAITAGALAIFLMTFAGHANRSYWQNFRLAMDQQLKTHQEQDPALQDNPPDPGFRNWEGWDKDQIEADAALHPFAFESEHGNLFVIINHLFATRLPVQFLVYVSAFAIALLLFLFYRRKTTGRELPAFTIALLGFCLYMISDLCSPFYRFQYNTTQWLFPLLLAAAHYNRQYKKIYALIAAGLLLNIVEIHSIPFEHTAGEWLFFLAVLLIAFRYQPPGKVIQLK